MFQKTGTGITNLATNETFDITQRPFPEDPMATAARLIQDDLALMFERPDGEYYLLAGSILLAGFWRFIDKFKMPLSEIHTSGDVPQYREKLHRGMMNFFRRLKPEEPVLRNNYFRIWRGRIVLEPRTRRLYRGIRRRRTGQLSITISGLSGSRCGGCRGRGLWFLRFGRTLSLLRRLLRSRMCPAGWRRLFGVGGMMFRGIRGRRGMRRFCWSIWIESMMSRLRVAWSWIRRMRCGVILIEFYFFCWLNHVCVYA